MSDVWPDAAHVRRPGFIQYLGFLLHTRVLDRATVGYKPRQVVKDAVESSSTTRSLPVPYKGLLIVTRCMEVRVNAWERGSGACSTLEKVYTDVDT